MRKTVHERAVETVAVLLVLTACAFLTPFASTIRGFVMAQEEASPARGQSRVLALAASCGGYCDWTLNNLCSAGLTCMPNPNNPTRGVCVNNVATGCHGGNPCCNVTPTPASTKTPSPVLTSTVTNGPVPSANPTANPSGGPIFGGDCSGPTVGTPDGTVDLRDVEQFRRELNAEVTTVACDFDANGIVDIIDFTNYLRPGYAQAAQTTAARLSDVRIMSMK